MQEVRQVGGGVRRSFVGVDLRRPKGYSPPPAATPAPEMAAACPRCESTNTKFCYYNNYNTAQPRHFCKSCRRYWTKGGTLRNVPVGGATRKSGKRSSSSSSKSKSEKRGRTVSSKSNSDNSSTVTVVEHPNPSVDDPNEQRGQQQEQLFPEAEPVGRSFTSLIESDDAGAIGLGLSDPGPVDETKLEETQLPVFDWPGSVVDANLFDIGSYLNQNHWVDPDPTLFFP